VLLRSPSLNHGVRLFGCVMLAASLTAMAAGVALPGCRRAAAPTNVPPPRIVTYSPALTGMLFDMGLGDHVVGVTGQCQLPPGQARPVVGDSYSVNAEAIAAVEPDLVLIQQKPEVFDALRKVKPNVRIEHFDIETLADIAAALERIGKLAGDEKLGVRAREGFHARLAEVRQQMKDSPRPKVLFLIAYQYDKPGTGGERSFVHELIDIAGGADAAGRYTRWADLDASTILSLQPDVLVVWTRPSSLDQARQYWQGFAGLNVPKDRIFVVTDPNWTIPSPRIADLAGELAKMVHPQAATTSAPAGVRP
jgi:iron complex transport system substrate-binding protein